MNYGDSQGAHDLNTVRLVQQSVAFVFGQPSEEIAARTRRNKQAALARQVAMYLAHVVCGMSLQRVAIAFNRDRTTVSHACRVVEDRREDPGFDANLDGLESFLRAAPRPLDGVGA